jgi:hypothetical protein
VAVVARREPGQGCADAVAAGVLVVQRIAVVEQANRLLPLLQVLCDPHVEPSPAVRVRVCVCVYVCVWGGGGYVPESVWCKVSLNCTGVCVGCVAV